MVCPSVGRLVSWLVGRLVGYLVGLFSLIKHNQPPFLQNQKGASASTGLLELFFGQQKSFLQSFEITLYSRKKNHLNLAKNLQILRKRRKIFAMCN